MRTNDLGQPIGDPVPDWTPRTGVGPVTLTGRTCRIEPLGVLHIDGLYAAMVESSGPSLWTYMSHGPFEDKAGFTSYVERLAATDGVLPFAVLDAAGAPLGVATYLRDEPAQGSVEVGHIAMSEALQRTTIATEAMYLMARHVFDDLGYRRYEWKCDSLNEKSRRAAARFGFRYEGRFRQALVYKGRNRDTDWFAITDGDWPALRAVYERWLDPANFDDDGTQRTSLSALTGRHTTSGDAHE